jgi:hypothetical protein
MDLSPGASTTPLRAFARHDLRLDLVSVGLEIIIKSFNKNGFNAPIGQWIRKLHQQTALGFDRRPF